MREPAAAERPWAATDPKVLFSRALDSVEGNARLVEPSVAEEGRCVARLGGGKVEGYPEDADSTLRLLRVIPELEELSGPRPRG